MQVQSAYEQVNLNLLLDYGRWQFDVYVTNALDSAPRLDYDVISGLEQANTLRPRTVGASLRTQF
jgi:hypothetical protein